MSEFRLIDPASGEVIFDSSDPIPEQFDPERDHIIAGQGWVLQTREQLRNELIRDGADQCPNCGSIVLTLDDDYWTCQICKTSWKADQ